MPVIAFACFVVVTQQTFAFDYKGEAVLVQVFRAWKRRRYFPDNNLRERVFGVGDALSDKFGRFHGSSVPTLHFVVNADNERKFCGVSRRSCPARNPCGEAEASSCVSEPSDMLAAKAGV